MYEYFQYLLDKYGVTAYKVAKETGVTTATLTNWKKGKYNPKPDKLQKIADYFGVPLSYLLTGKMEEEKKESPLTSRDDRDIEKKLTETLNQLESGDGLMFNGEVMDEETKRLLEISLRSTLESAKITAKKFTPKKYRK